MTSKTRGRFFNALLIPWVLSVWIAAPRVFAADGASGAAATDTQDEAAAPQASDRADRRQGRDKPAPTFADLAYGDHAKNILDFWKADSAEPAPLVLYFFGGGFVGGNKSSINARVVGDLLEAGISVAAIQYRVISDDPLPAAHQDAQRAVQFLRSKAEEWNIDKTRVGAFGGSSGAQLAMYLAMKDDAADPDSADPVARESTRLTCVAPSSGQTTRNFDLWMEWIPGYDKPHSDPLAYFGAQTKEEYLAKVPEVSPLDLISADDPPIFMSYFMAPDDPIPSEPDRVQNWQVHHVVFGVKLKEKADALGVEAHLKYPGAETAYASEVEFFKAKFQLDQQAEAQQDPQ